MRRLRRSQVVAFVGVAALLFAAFATWAPSSSPLVAILSPLWLVSPALVTVVLRRRVARPDEQPVALLSILLSRAPPANAALV